MVEIIIDKVEEVVKEEVLVTSLNSKRKVIGIKSFTILIKFILLYNYYFLLKKIKKFK